MARPSPTLLLMLLAVLAVLAALLCPAAGAASQTTPALGLSSEEVQRIVGLGPWPPTLRPDPGNRVSGQAQAIELGLQRWYGWGGASDSLWMASIRPILDAREFDSSPASVAKLFDRDLELAACDRRVFKEAPQAKPQSTIVNVGKALAAIQETLVPGRTAFDDFRDALARGDAAAAAAYPAAAQRGLRLLVGPAQSVEPLSAQQVDDLAAFLATLSDQYGTRRPGSTAGLAGCP